jgi:hypothetical protein
MEASLLFSWLWNYRVIFFNKDIKEEKEKK